MLELASGKGAFALHLARNFGCKVEGFDVNPEFVAYSKGRAKALGLASKAQFAQFDVNSLSVHHHAYDLGVCLGALYIFRESGWRVLMKSVKPGGWFAISEMFCKNASAPREIMEVFFEESGQPFTREDARRWYTSKRAEILREEECSRKAWLEYYDSTKQNILQLAERHRSEKDKMLEIEDALREDSLVRELGEKYLGYVTSSCGNQHVQWPLREKNRIFDIPIPRSDGDEQDLRIPICPAASHTVAMSPALPSPQQRGRKN